MELHPIAGARPLLTSHRICAQRSEEHTSELQSPCNLVCRLLLEKNNTPSPSEPAVIRSPVLRAPGLVLPATLSLHAQQLSGVSLVLTVSDRPFRLFFFLMIRRPPRSTLFPYNDALPISNGPPPPQLPAIAIISYEYWQRRFGGN